MLRECSSQTMLSDRLLVSSTRGSSETGRPPRLPSNKDAKVWQVSLKEASLRGGKTGGQRLSGTLPALLASRVDNWFLVRCARTSMPKRAAREIAHVPRESGSSAGSSWPPPTPGRSRPGHVDPTSITDLGPFLEAKACGKEENQTQATRQFGCLAPCGWLLSLNPISSSQLLHHQGWLVSVHSPQRPTPPNRSRQAQRRCASCAARARPGVRESGRCIWKTRQEGCVQQNKRCPDFLKPATVSGSWMDHGWIMDSP